MSFGTTPVSTTTLSANQFPVSAVAVPGHSGGNLTALEGGPASTDGNGNETAPASMYIKDGGNVALGTTSDLSSANTLIGLTKAIKTSVASITVGTLPALPAGSNTIGNVGLVAGSAVIGGVELVDSGGTNKASISAGGAVKVDASATIQPVSGTFWQATQPISAASLPLPSGASTSAKQPALGTAGSASADVLTVQGIASMTALKVDGSGVTQPVSGSVTANIGTTNGLALDATVAKINVAQAAALGSNTGPMIQGSVTTNAPAYSTGNINPLSLDTSGLLRTSLKDTPSNTNNLNVNLAASAATVTVSATNLQTNLNQIAGSNVATAATGIQKVGLTDGTGTALTSTSNALDVNIKSGGGSGFSVVDEASWTAGTSAMVPAGGVFNDSAAALTSGQEGTVRLTNNRAIHVNLRDASANQLLGSKTSASSIPVVVASDQGAIPASQSGTWNITNISGTVSLPTGAAQDSSVNGILVSQGSTTSGEKGPLVQGAVTTSSPSYTTAQTSPLSLTTAGALRVDASATTQPISAASLPLPSGAATSAKQPALGTAGTASSDVITVQGIASMTALKVDGSGVTQPVSGTFWQATQPVSGTVTANQGGSNWSVNVAQIGASNVATAATGVQKVGIVGNAGATVDSTVAAGTAPANAIVAGSVYNTSAPAPTNGQAMAIQADQAGNTRTFPGIALATLSAWSSGTSLNATQNIFTNSGAEAVLVQLTQTTTLTGGAVTFEVSYDGSNWFAIPANCVLDPSSNTFAQISVPYTVQANTNKAFLLNMNGAQALRAKLSTQITGTGTVTPNYALLPASPADTVVALSPTAANFNVTIGTGANTIGAVTQASGPWTNNITQFGGSNVVTGTGAGGSGIPRVTVSNDSNVLATQSGTWTVQPGNTANTTPWLVQTQAGTAGGSTGFHAISAATNNATSIKGSAGLVYGYTLSNTNASARYVKLYNKASSPSPATDNALILTTIQVPGNATVIAAIPEGLTFGTGIGMAAIANMSDTDNTSIGAGDLSIDIRYK